MKRVLLRGAIALLLFAAPLRAEDEEGPSIDDVMQQVLDAVDGNEKKMLARLAQL